MDWVFIKIYHWKQRQNAQQRIKKKENLFKILIFTPKAFLGRTYNQIKYNTNEWKEYPTRPNLNLTLYSMLIKHQVKERKIMTLPKMERSPISTSPKNHKTS